MARGHRIEKIAEVPLVIADAEFDGIAKTKDAVKLLRSIGAYDDVKRVKDSRHIRPGKGKARNRRYIQKRGPLIIHNKVAEGKRLAPTLVSAFRNIPGIDFCHVSRLNLLQLAPGGHIGRFIVWTEGAFKQLDNIFGSRTADSVQKKHYRPPTSLLTNADINRVINSEEIQSVLRPIQRQPRTTERKKNPLKNFGFMLKLNPYAATQRRRALRLSSKSRKAPAKKVEDKKGAKGGVKKPNLKKKETRAHKKKRLAKFLAVYNTPSIAPKRSELEKVKH
jgi:large subunit ribosomal protein L4e